MGRETWQFVNTFASWVSALATFSAVAVSLYLATRDRKICLAVNASIRTIVFAGQTLDTGTKVISIRVTNVGFRKATVTSIFWTMGRFRKVYFQQVPSTIPFSSKLPATVADGEEASYPIELSEFERMNIDSFRKSALHRFPKLSARSIKIGVSTSTGKIFTSKIEPALNKWFLERIS